ncbi:hypothetical protein INT48_009660 [Thamnidium elegans]|uniref:Uncharacterized protein n=1 Tax=Thamnidium elegans TaxID=101142 RepID=A0A8H7SYU9_9FUNG|nr:hypothetical protein INT48_009660 [Thamnidium elegans]
MESSQNEDSTGAQGQYSNVPEGTTVNGFDLYPSETPCTDDDDEQEENNVKFAFLPDDPENKEVYVQKSLINNEIFSTVWKYTDLFDEKPAIGFNQWCTNKVDFATVKTKRKNQDSDDMAKKVQNYLPINYLFEISKRSNMTL